MRPAQQKMKAEDCNAVIEERNALEAWALEEVLKRILAGDQETIKMLNGKTFLARDQYGQVDKAYLASNLNGKFVVTTEDDLV